jgi:hypothetical protein
MNRMFATLSLPFAVHMMDEARATALLTLARSMPPGPACVRALTYFEPDVPWNAEFLSFRAQCYQATRSSLAPHARADLLTFQGQNPAKFSESLTK